MKKRTIFLLLIMIAVALHPIETMKLSEVKEGMEGEGRTIFKGDKIETFSFKVLGIMRNIFPGKSLIIIEMASPVLAESGVIAGMSGSPAYINKKMIGAVAYSLANFSKRPIAGVTPIEDILDTADYDVPNVSIDISNIKVDFEKKNSRKILNLIQGELVRRMGFNAGEKLSPIKLVGINRGLNPLSLSLLDPVFHNVHSMVSSGSQIKTRDVGKELFEIRTADAAAVPLVRGDMEYSASGTVTLVDKDKIYLFGHPFYNLGRVNFPLHQARVISVVPSVQSSFKLTSTGNQVGTVTQDRFSSINGTLGVFPYMIPMKVFMRNRNRKMNLELVNHPLLTPALSYISLNSIFMSEYQQYGFQSINVTGKIYIENEKNIVLNDFYSGANSYEEFTYLVMAINFFLLNNKDKNIKIQSLDFEINSSETVRKTMIENVILDKNSFVAGEIINMGIHMRNERGNRMVENINIKAPNLKPGSSFYVMVADKNEMISFDSRNVRSSFFPVKLSSLIRIINNLRKNNRIYVKVLSPSRGLFIRGHEYANLPQSYRNLYQFNTATNDLSEMKFSTLQEYQMELPAVVEGKKLFKLKIKER